MKTSITAAKYFCLALGMVLTVSGNCMAQWDWGHGHDHDDHGFDSAGHIIDAFGHHVDHSGNHTGNTGVFEDGYREYTGQSYPSQWYYDQSYPSAVLPSSNYVPSTTVISSTVSNPLPSTSVTSNTSFTNEPINIINPSKYGITLSFKVNGQQMRLESGQQTTLKFDRNYVIEFDRGGGNGAAKYSLSAGDFRFGVHGNGWDLKRAKLEENPLPSAGMQTASNPLPDQE